MGADSQIADLLYVWDSGVTDRWEWQPSQSVEDLQAFKLRTSSTRVTSLRWRCGSRTFECPYPGAIPLPDFTGLVIAARPQPIAAPGETYLRVINADGSDRLRIDIPVVDALSIPAEGFVELPRTNFYGLEFGVPGNDGHWDYVFDFDWETGKLIRAVPAPEMRR